MSDSQSLIPSEMIEKKIFIIRGKKVMLDKDLADLYGVETKQLKRAVNRNIERFPEDFMFELTKEEDDSLRCQIGTLKRGEHSKYLPFVFTEYGILMLSSVLNSKRAVQVNIQIMRVFTKLREMLMNYKDLQEKIDAMEKKYDNQFKNVFEAIKLLIQNDQHINQRFVHEESQQKNKKYGFRPKG
jgi:flagellar capping protein FliD